MQSSTIKIPCIQVTQPIGEFYSGVMDSTDLVRISYADIRQLTDRALDEYMGIQRQLSKGRVQEISKYVKTVDATFPTSIILSISSEDAVFDPGTSIMTIRDGENVAKIIDGQHRIAGLTGSTIHPFQLNVTLFIDMDIEDQAMVFATINLAQTKVNKSLVYDLYEYAKARSPQKTSHNIARLLNSDQESPFHKRIKILGTAVERERLIQTITQATFVEATIRMISGGTARALQDRDLLQRNKMPPRKVTGEERELIFRNMFLDNKDEDIASVIWNYFSAVKARWQQSWEDTRRSGNILPRTNGFRAFMRFLPNLYHTLGRPDSVPTQEAFFGSLQQIQLTDSDFTSDRYKPGSSGERDLLTDLLQSL